MNEVAKEHGMKGRVDRHASMNGNLFIFIGGSDATNRDYSLVHRLAKSGGITNWSSLKGAKPGDRALIYVQKPHSALIAKAEVLSRPMRGAPGDYAYRARTGRFELLPNQVTIQDLKRKFPRWPWLRYPRGKAIVPARYAARLWKLVHAKSWPVQILISNAGFGQALLRKLAATGKSVSWTVPKLTSEGDTVLFYVVQPVGAVLAIGKALSKPKVTSNNWYKARVGQVRLLDAPIGLIELREMFPDWAWLQNMSMFAYVSPKRAKALLERCSLPSSSDTSIVIKGVGAGFGNARTNPLVEKAAVRKVTRMLQRRGFAVRSREAERIGYDLDATKGRIELHVEVKGVSGSVVRFPITQAEVNRAALDKSFRLMVVTEARSPQAKVHEARNADFQREFILKPICYFAEKK